MKGKLQGIKNWITLDNPVEGFLNYEELLGEVIRYRAGPRHL